jgi:hypothetical protein
MKGNGTKLVLGTVALLAGVGAVKRRRGSSAVLTMRDGRWYPFFYGSRRGDYEEYENPILSFRREGFDWELAASMSSRNDWRNWMVEGATERDQGLRKALRGIVARYPEAAEFDIKFDGPWTTVGDLLRMDIESPQQIEFLHGTSTAAWERIRRQGLRPRRQHGGPAAYGAHLEHVLHEADKAAVYLTTQIGTASWAARDAARVSDSKPIVLSIKGVDIDRLEADEDSGLYPAAWKRSLEVLGSVKHRGSIPANKITIFGGGHA